MLKKFIKDLIANYSRFDNMSRRFILPLYELPDFVHHEFSALLMASNHDIACESTGPDNPYYEKLMLPALLKYLSDTSNKDYEIEFVTAWQKGLLAYHEETLEHMIDEALIDYNSDRRPASYPSLHVRDVR